MARAKYAELVFVADDNADLPRHTLSGYVVCSDYTSDGRRHLFLKRMGPERQAKIRSKVAKKAASAKPLVVSPRAGESNG